MNESSTPIQALCRALPAGDGPPGWLLLVPAGRFEGRDGRFWVNDRPDEVVAAFEAAGQPLPIDWEHATEIKAPAGDPAPAAGWITALEVRGGEVWGLAEWTGAALEQIKAKAYRYYSPAFLFDPDSRRVVALTSVGLTNRPNLHVPALNQRQEHAMQKSLLAALGLPETADDKAALDAVTALKARLDTALNAAKTPNLEQYVPRADYDAALNRAKEAEAKLVEMERQRLEAEIEAEIEKALEAGKITPATVDYHKAQCRLEGGLERFRQFVEAAPAIVGRKDQAGGRPPEQGHALCAEERYVCAQLGIPEDEFSKLKE